MAGCKLCRNPHPKDGPAKTQPTERRGVSHRAINKWAAGIVRKLKRNLQFDARQDRLYKNLSYTLSTLETLYHGLKREDEYGTRLPDS
jgi:hypothetical protein